MSAVSAILFCDDILRLNFLLIFCVDILRLYFCRLSAWNHYSLSKNFLIVFFKKLSYSIFEKHWIQTYNQMLMTILTLVLETNAYSILIKNVDDNTESSTGINVNKQTKILNLGLVPQPWIKILNNWN